VVVDSSIAPSGALADVPRMPECKRDCPRPQAPWQHPSITTDAAGSQKRWIAGRAGLIVVIDASTSVSAASEANSLPERTGSADEVFRRWAVLPSIATKV